MNLPGRYIHKTPNGWRGDPMHGQTLDIRGAYTKARDQFNTHAFSEGLETDIFQKVVELLQQEGTIKGQLGDFIQQLDNLRRGGNAIHAQSIEAGGMSTSFRELAFAKKDGRKDKTIPRFVKAIESSLEPGGKCMELAKSLEEVKNYIDSFGDFKGGRWFDKNKETGQLGPNAKLRVGGAKGATFIALRDCSQISNSYHKLEQIIAKAKGGKGGLRAGNIRSIVQELKTIGNTFIRNFSGAVNEFTRVAETQAVLNVEENIQQFVDSFGLQNVNFQVSQVGGAHPESASGTKRVSKGDTEILMTYELNGVEGTWRTTISEKSGPLNVISKFNQNKSFSGNLVGGAAYSTIFDGLGWQIEKLFCNTYLHESVQNDTMLMSYIGARAASNIIAGTAGAGQAAVLRENNELITIDKLFETILDEGNAASIDRYINLRVEPLTPDSDVKGENKYQKSDGEDGSQEAARIRSQRVYEAIKNSVHFYANLGSRRGFSKM